MSLVESQFAEPVSVQDDDLQKSPSSSAVDLDPGHDELDVQPSGESITSEQSEPADNQAEVQSESGTLSVSNSIVDENSPPEEALDPESPTNEPVRKVSATTPAKKGPMSVSTNTAKANGGPPTPLVKKIINSGTFGSGSVKPAPGVRSSVSGSAVATKPPATASALKRSTTTAPTTTTKPTVASRTPTTSAPAPARRASLAPSAKPAASSGPRPSLASSTTARPRPSSISSKPPADVAKARASVTSPTLSTTSAKSATTPRPKAAISDAAKKPTTTARTTASSRVSAPGKPAGTTARTPSVTKATATKPSGSISSIKELKEKENSQAIEALQAQLKEAEESLQTKVESVGALETQLQELQGSLQAALEDAQTKTARVGELEAEKTALEGDLNAAKESHASLQAERDADKSLEQARADLEAANVLSLASATQVGELQAQVIELKVTIASKQEELDALHAAQSASLSDAAQASAIEREALLKAQADFDAISKEVDALKAAHAEALRSAEAKIGELEPRVAEVEALQSQLGGLKEEKEETANKISELEVEVLELKEQVEEFEDLKKKLEAKAASLEADLARSGEALEAAKKAAADKEAEVLAQLDTLKAEHASEAKDASDRFNALQSSLKLVEEQLAGALAAAEQSSKDLVAAQAAHDERVKELKSNFSVKEADLNRQIVSIQESLDNQEAVYNGKVQVVKDEHEVRLKEAFERAKNEAGSAHAQELQNLRAESNATVAQIQDQNKRNLESLQSDHTADLDSVTKGHNKQIGNLNLELKATQDDLIKSKATVDELRKEVEIVKGQLDAAKASANAVPTVSPEQVEEVARLSQELAVAKDDLAAVTDVLNLTKSSLAEMSDKHQKDSEQSAKDRAEEALKVAARHDEEIKALASQKHDLLIRLSDLEGELSTAKAALSAAQTASPKANGTSPRVPASPGVSKEELAKLHEAHTLKIYDLQAEHEQSLKALRDELLKAQEDNGQLKQEVERKNMEMRYLESDLEELQGEVKDYKERLGEADAA